MSANFSTIRLSVAILAISTLLFLSGCRETPEQSITKYQEALTEIRKEFVPDRRIDVFSIEAIPYGNSVVLSGEVMQKGLPGIIQERLGGHFPGTTFTDSIRILPDPNRRKTWGIVNISVANMREHPKFQAQLVNQSLMGTVVRLLKEDNGFYYIQNRDQYLGWMHKLSVIAVDSMTAAEWQNGPKVTAVANYSVIRRENNDPDDPNDVIADLVPGMQLKLLGKKAANYRISAPDGRTGLVPQTAAIDHMAMDRIKATRDRLQSTSKSFLGAPYLWGGTSAKGFDCSGFVQTVFRLNNIELPRDASQMVHEGTAIDISENFDLLQAGDLLFFGSRPGRITHVAMYLDNGLYIHSSTSVHINSLLEDHTLFSEYRRKTLQSARRILDN